MREDGSNGSGDNLLPAILVCDCGSTEHQIVIYPDKDEGLAYCHIHLTGRGFWQRLGAGLKYIFGHRSRFGHWDEFILRPEHANKLRELSEMLSRQGKGS